MSDVSERAYGRASGPVLTSLFLFDPDHSAADPSDPAAVLHQRIREREERQGQVTASHTGNSGMTSGVALNVTPSRDTGRPKRGPENKAAMVQLGLDQRGKDLAKVRVTDLAISAEF